MPNNPFVKLSPILKNINIIIKTKLRILKSDVWSILLYGCESLPLTRSHENNVQIAEMLCGLYER